MKFSLILALFIPISLYSMDNPPSKTGDKPIPEQIKKYPVIGLPHGGAWYYDYPTAAPIAYYVITREIKKTANAAPKPIDYELHFP